MVRIFAYGELKNFSKPDPLGVGGELRLLPNDDAAAHFNGVGQVWGQAYELPTDTFNRLIGEEVAAGFVPVVVATSDGQSAMAFEYFGPGWDDATPIPGGVYKP